ncbi:hypothetical protein JW865_04165 [Candidatus Bathyarchaeota archaeon]|nr:hypothetical protein [Candidatus Bathyarchaeota archaeon]
MSDYSQFTVYFNDSGKLNTDETLKLAKDRADKLGIQNIVVASYTGETGVKASTLFKGYNLIIVAGTFGFREANKSRMITENRIIIEENGGKILHATHAFGTLGRAVNRKFNTIQVDEIIANVLRLFGQGTKVACEICCMAADAGLINIDEEVIGIAGSGGGCDTALVLQPANTHNFFDTKIKEIICKPRDWKPR